MSNIADIIRMNSLTDERNAARAENKLLKARIAAVEARERRIEWLLREAEAGIFHGDARGEPKYIIESIRFALAASPTPTGPEPATCEHGLIRCAVCGTDVPATPEPTEETDNLDRRRGGYITSDREMVIPAVPAGPGPGGATPEPTEETP